MQPNPIHNNQSEPQSSDNVKSRRRTASFRRRAAGLYLTTFMISTIVVGTAATLMKLQYANRRIQRNVTAAQQSEFLSPSAMELALTQIQEDSNWRVNYTSGVNTPIALTPRLSAVYSLTEPDGDFTDDDTDPVQLSVAALSGNTTHSIVASMLPKPHPALGYTVFANGIIELWSSTTLDGKVYAQDGFFSLSGSTFNGSQNLRSSPAGVIASDMSGVNSITLKSKPLNPDPSYFITRSTTVISTLGAGGYEVKNAVLTESTNTLGVANPDGIYHVATKGNDLFIEDVFIRGTLVITAAPGDFVTFRGGVFIDEGITGQPSVIITGAPQGVWFTPDLPLVEPILKLDLNGDGDTLDTIASNISGLIWTDAVSLYLGGAGANYSGSVIGNDIYMVDNTFIAHDNAIDDRLISGFTDGTLHLQRGSILEN
jgi:hypothetical protein